MTPTMPPTTRRRFAGPGHHTLARFGHLSDETGAGRLRRRRGARVQPELAEDVRDVPVHGVRAENQLARDVRLALPLCNEPEDITFARRQLLRTADRRRCRGRRDAEEGCNRARKLVDIAVPGWLRVAVELDQAGARDER